MTVYILDDAKDDIVMAAQFYESQQPGLGIEFQKHVISEIEALEIHCGVHQVVYGSYRKLCQKFPFAIYYRCDETHVFVMAVLDCRQNPKRTKAFVSDRDGKNQ